MLANINLLEYIDLILDWGSSSCPSPAKKKACVEKEILLHSWKFLPNSVRSHWLLRGHMTSNNKTVSRQNLSAGNVAKSMKSEGNSALLPADVDRRPQLHPQTELLISFSQPFLRYHRASSQGRPCLYVIKIKLWNELISMSRFNHFFKWLKRLFEAIQFTFLLNS